MHNNTIQREEQNKDKVNILNLSLTDEEEQIIDNSFEKDEWDDKNMNEEQLTELYDEIDKDLQTIAEFTDSKDDEEDEVILTEFGF